MSQIENRLNLDNCVRNQQCEWTQNTKILFQKDYKLFTKHENLKNFVSLYLQLTKISRCENRKYKT